MKRSEKNAPLSLTSCSASSPHRRTTPPALASSSAASSIAEDVARQLNEVVRAKLRVRHAAGAGAWRSRPSSSPAACAARKSSAAGFAPKETASAYLGDNRKALVVHNAQPSSVFRQIGNATEEARTLIPSIHSLIFLGRYDEAFEAAEAAKKILSQLGRSSAPRARRDQRRQHLPPPGPLRRRPGLLRARL